MRPVNPFIPALRPNQRHILGTGLLSQGQSGRGVKLTTHIYLRPSIRMSGTIPLLPLYAFIEVTGTTLPLPLLLWINTVRRCSANLEDKNSDPQELVSTSRNTF
jgi:hypothetical protein